MLRAEGWWLLKERQERMNGKAGEIVLCDWWNIYTLSCSMIALSKGGAQDEAQDATAEARKRPAGIAVKRVLCGGGLE